MKSVKIEGQSRVDLGKKATRSLRTEGKVPAVIYGGEKTISFSAPASAFKHVVYTPDFQIAEIAVDGTTYKCILKDLQFDAVTDALQHIDFLQLVDDKKVIANLPLKYTGQPEGVKAGGRLELKMKTVRVRTFPKDLKEAIEVNIAGLKLNENMRVQDIVVENMEIMNSPRIPIASVVMTRALKQAENADAKEGKKK
jgi:large subunit ribosomal protein L25